MLKIRDDIDLKELEKYGFEENSEHYYREKTGNYAISYPYGVIIVDKETKEIEIVYHIIEGLNKIIDENIVILKSPIGLYELIKDGLVEKVEE